MTEAGTQHENHYHESRSRAWYCLYVLDRLLALQLGRPPAIFDQDCHAPIPHPLPELELDGQEVHEFGTRNGLEPRLIGDYFASMIRFSSIVGRVLRETYHPRRQILSSLGSTEGCDKQLLEWKNRLPRHLRFDVGHVFEKSVTFRRQVINHDIPQKKHFPAPSMTANFSLQRETCWRSSSTTSEF